MRYHGGDFGILFSSICSLLSLHPPTSLRPSVPLFKMETLFIGFVHRTSFDYNLPKLPLLFAGTNDAGREHGPRYAMPGLRVGLVRSHGA